MDADATPLRILLLAAQVGRGGMVRYMVELADGRVAAGHGGVVVAGAGGDGDTELEALAQRLPVRLVPRLGRGELRAALRESDAQVMKLCTGAFPPDTRLRARLAGTGVGVVESLHSLPRRMRVGRRRRIGYALAARRSRLVVFSRGMEVAVREHLPAWSSRLRRLRMGITLPAAPPRAASEAAGPLRWITVTRLDESHKDTRTLIDALAILHAGGSGARLTIVGDGPDRRDLEVHARDRGVAHAAHFAGWCDDIASRLAAHDAFVLSTRSESFGRVNVEAAAVGLPVVATDVLGCRDSVANGVSGLLVTPADPSALADAMLRLERDAALRTRLAAEGPAHARTFSMAAHVPALAAVLREVSR